MRLFPIISTSRIATLTSASTLEQSSQPFVSFQCRLSLISHFQRHLICIQFGRRRMHASTKEVGRRSREWVLMCNVSTLRAALETNSSGGCCWRWERRENECKDARVVWMSLHLHLHWVEVADSVAVWCCVLIFAQFSVWSFFHVEIKVEVERIRRFSVVSWQVKFHFGKHEPNCW